MRRALGLAMVLGAARLVAAQEPAPPPRPRACLALSGGGARGLAHIGVLRALEEAAVPIDCIAGTSMGAVVGALYASGLDAARLEEIARTAGWSEMFAGEVDRTLRPVSLRVEDVEPVVSLGFDSWKLRLPEAAVADYGVNRFLARHLLWPGYRAGGDFDRLPIPFRAVATDLQTGERVVLTSGRLDRAVRASMSIPLAFAPVDLGGRLLVDGGLTDNLPVDVARGMGADVVIGVDVSSPPSKPVFWDVSAVAGQVTSILMRARNLAHQEPADVTIRPALGAHGFMDYTGIDVLLEAGRAAVRARIDEVLRSAARVASARIEGSVRRMNRDQTALARVSVAGNEHVEERLIVKLLGLRPGGPFDLAEALRGMDTVYATDLFDSCWMSLEPEGAEAVAVVLHVKEKARGAVELGLSYNEGDEAGAFLRLRDRNVLGWGERADLTTFVSDAEKGVRAALSGDRLAGLPLGYVLRARRFDEKPRVFVAGDLVNRARFGRRGMFAGLRRSVGRPLLLEAGVHAGSVGTEPRLGLDFQSRRDRVRALAAEVTWDRLDDSDSPSTGEGVVVSVEKGLTGLGATRDYWRGRLGARAAFPLGPGAALYANALAGASGGDTRVYELFRLGGPMLLPGYHREELWGAQAAALSLGVGVRVAGRVRLTVRAGAGGVWPTRRDVTVQSLRAGFGLEGQYPTRVGPASLGVGVTGSGRTLVYVSLGFQ